MLRLLARLILNVLANALGLLAASIFIDGFSISGISFFVAVFIFSATTTILGPLVIKIAFTHASYLIGGIALVTTFVGLLITDLISDGLSISGTSTWLFGTLIVWVFSLIGTILLPMLLFKKVLEKNKN